jgi:membrane associated rhomboid family serine protease
MRYGRRLNFGLNPVWVIIGLNFLLFIVTVAWGKGFFNVQGTLISAYKAHFYLGLMPAAFWERPWTIVTNMFIHAGFWHILGNMITFYFFGTFLSRLVGQGKLLLVYFAGGIVGNIFFILWGLWQMPFSMAVGASGAIFALAGVLVVMMPRLRVFVYFILPMPLWLVVILFFGLWSVPGFVSPNVAWQVHLGGLLTGLVAGYFFRRRERYYYYR